MAEELKAEIKKFLNHFGEIKVFSVTKDRLNDSPACHIIYQCHNKKDVKSVWREIIQRFPEDSFEKEAEIEKGNIVDFYILV